MNAVGERVQAIIFELGDLKGRAKTVADYELADYSMRALRDQWEKYCKDRILYREMRENMRYENKVANN